MVPSIKLLVFMRSRLVQTEYQQVEFFCIYWLRFTKLSFCTFFGKDLGGILRSMTYDDEEYDQLPSSNTLKNPLRE